MNFFTFQEMTVSKFWIVVYMWLQNHIWGGGARWWSYRKWRHRPWPEMTSPELEVTFPPFFLTIVVVQNVSLRMTDRATGSNVTGFPRVRTCETRSWGFLPISLFTRNDVTRRVKKKYGKKVRGKDSLTGRNPTSGCAPKGTWPSVNSDSPIGHAQLYYCTTTIGRKERGNRLRIRRAYFRTRDWRHFRSGMVTLLPVALSVMRNGTFCTTTASGHVTSGDVTSGCACARDHFW